MTDFFSRFASDLSSPATGGQDITPSDGTDLTIFSRALWVGGAGSLRVITVEDDTINLVGIPAGTLMPIRVKRVLATGTTATAIVALW